MNAADVANWNTRVRVRAGNPNATDVPELLITEAVTAGLREYGKYRGPDLVVITQTAAEQQEYVAPTGFSVIHDVLWGDDVDVRGDIFLRENAVQPFEYLEGHDIFKSPSLPLLVYQQLEAYRTRFGGRFDVYDAPTGGLMIRLSPPPWSVQKMAIMGRGFSTLQNVPDHDQEILMAACLWKLNTMRHEGSAAIQSISTGGGSITFGTQNYQTLSEKHEKAFKSAIGANLPQFMTG
jgi:hypothetical protein